MIHMNDREIGGFCHNNFQNVSDTFLNNLNSDEEVGASYTVIQNSEIVVDIYGGFKDKDQIDPWNVNTLVGVHSTGKGIISMIIALLIDQKKLNLDEYVSAYWPEFKGGGKEEIKVRTLLSHQAGMYAWREKVHEDDFHNWDHVVELLEKQIPFHKPNELICYHPKTIGFLVGELIKRITKKSIGEFLKEKISIPLNADCFIGTPEVYHDNIATLISAPSLRKAFSDPKNIDEYTLKSFLNPGNRTKTANTKEYRLAEIPALNCHSNSRSLAQIYDYFLNNDFISKDTLNQVTSIEVKGDDQVMKKPMQWSPVGFSIGGGKLFGKSSRSFGHTGWGGSMAFADPDNNLCISYTMNMLTGSMLGDQRALNLVEATYKNL
jgi:CubicO group peptidase (beta-lactamase class C family)